MVKHELNVFLRLVATSWQNSCQRRCVTLSTNMFTFIIIEVDLYFFFVKQEGNSLYLGGFS